MSRQSRVTDRIRLKGCAVADVGSAAGPVVTDRMTAVPIDRRLADRIEDLAARRRQLGHLDHRAGMALVQKIDERPARSLAALADYPAVLDGPVEPLVIVFGPARPVLQTLVPGGEKVAVHAGRPVALLDQLELHIAG